VCHPWTRPWHRPRKLGLDIRLRRSPPDQGWCPISGHAKQPCPGCGRPRHPHRRFSMFFRSQNSRRFRGADIAFPVGVNSCTARLVFLSLFLSKNRPFRPQPAFPANGTFDRRSHPSQAQTLLIGPFYFEIGASGFPRHVSLA